MTCKWNGSGNPRVLTGRHAPDCADAEACSGCQPCEELHCCVCRKAHGAVTCPECLGAARDDLHVIAELCHALPTETIHRGVNSEAAMLWGPTADPEVWRNRAMSAMMGRAGTGRSVTRVLDDAYLEDCRDEMHPLWVLGTWEQTWRDTLDQPTDLEATLPRLVDYIDKQLHVMAEREEPPFEDFARDLRGCRAHLEDVLQEGIRDERGAPCLQCGQTMLRVITNRGAQDAYECRRCRNTVTGNQYRYAVGVAYLAHATHLTAPQIRHQYQVAEGSTRGWASKVTEEGEPAVRKRGKSDDGLVLYEVADVLAVRDGTRKALKRDIDGLVS